MAAVRMPYASFDFGNGDVSTVDIEYDDVTLDVNVFIIDNPGGHTLTATLKKPDGTVKTRTVNQVLHDFRYDPVLPAKFVMRTGPHNMQYLWWPVGWELTIACSG